MMQPVWFAGPTIPVNWQEGVAVKGYVILSLHFIVVVRGTVHRVSTFYVSEDIHYNLWRLVYAICTTAFGIYYPGTVSEFRNL
jgi:hypothetical protein